MHVSAALLCLPTIVSAQQTGSAALTWSPVVTYSDGTPLPAEDLAGYRAYWGTAQGDYPNSRFVDGATTELIDGLASGRWYFVVRAELVDGTQSGDSPVASKLIDNGPPTPVEIPGPVRNFDVRPIAITQLSPARYQLGVLTLGGLLYSDRTYVWTSTAGLDGAEFVIAANDDKATPTTVSFTLARPATVYVLHDTRIALPAWLASWSAAGTATATDGANGTQRRVLRRDFTAGPVALGVNGSSGNMYSVAVTPL